MGKNKERYRNLILDTNIIFSSLVKSEGVTRAAIFLLFSNSRVKVYSPETIIGEIRRHYQTLGRKMRMNMKLLPMSVEEIVKNIKLVKEASFKKQIKEALKCVTDGADAPFAGLALKLKPSIIVTYNKKHYKIDKLKNRSVEVATPIEALKMTGVKLMSISTKSKKKGDVFSVLSKIIAKIYKPDDIFS